MGYFSHWKLELLALLFNLASLTTLIALLAAFDGKALFNWHGLTLNTFKLFWKCKKEFLLLLGALTTIFAIAIDPFTQQLVQFEEKSTEVESFDVTIPRATRYAKGSVYTVTSDNSTQVNGVWFRPTSADADFAIQAAVFYGLTHSVEDSLRDAPFQCPTGNCTWDPFESLAVCSRCNNLSNMVQKRTAERDESEIYDQIIFELPNGLSLDAHWTTTNGSRLVQQNSNIKGTAKSCRSSDEGLLFGDAASTPRKMRASDGNSEGPGSR
ncbi:hypothetical protein DIS24_g11758 [Lasiodiplodia hormozganensis]|uniref:Uncharacterized protein n=1 Tax=Lasiodiplodia hormozganensis TaxID=869390 RepID=A0AA39WHH5_9PEZI|nr:hypothetical protein DIS24_g11758 [Lasiodiplodia hormozganensis]